MSGLTLAVIIARQSDSWSFFVDYSSRACAIPNCNVNRF